MTMKKLTKIICLLLCSILLFSMLGCQDMGDVVLYQDGMEYKVTEKGTPEPYATYSYDIIGGRDVMPIGGFCGTVKGDASINGVDYPNFMTEEYVKLLSEAGLNTIVYMNDRANQIPSDIKNLLEYGEKYGMGFYLNLDLIAGMSAERSPVLYSENKITEIAQTVYKQINSISSNMEYRSLLGLWFMDEVFPNNQVLNAIALKEKLIELGFGLDFYSNALGYWQGVWNVHNTCPDTDYETYAKSYMQLGLKMYSTTHYPYSTSYAKYKKANLSDEETDDAIKELLIDLLWERKCAIDNNQVYWRMMQAGHQFLGSASEALPVGPDEGEFLFDGNLALAMGSKAIQYFVPLAHPQDQLNPDGTYDPDRNSLIGITGKKNQWYYYAQKLSNQIKAVDHVLMNSAHMGIMACGKQAENLLSGMEGTEGIIAGNSWRQLKKVSGDSAFVGCFDYLGGTALYVLNSSRNNRASTTLSFDGVYCYDVVQRAEQCAVVGRSMTLNLQPGEAALIVLR